MFPRTEVECNGDFSDWTVFYDPTLTERANVCPVETYYTNGTDAYGSTLFLADVVDQASATIGISTITGTSTAPSLSVQVGKPSEGSTNAWTNPGPMQRLGRLRYGLVRFNQVPMTVGSPAALRVMGMCGSVTLWALVLHPARVLHTRITTSSGGK